MCFYSVWAFEVHHSAAKGGVLARIASPLTKKRFSLKIESSRNWFEKKDLVMIQQWKCTEFSCGSFLHCFSIFEGHFSRVKFLKKNPVSFASQGRGRGGSLGCGWYDIIWYHTYVIISYDIIWYGIIWYHMVWYRNHGRALAMQWMTWNLFHKV